MEMRSLYIVLTSTGTTLAKMISQYTKDKYNHVSLAMDIDLLEMYSFGRKNPVNPLSGGFVHEDVENGTYSWFPDTETIVLELKVERNIYNNIVKVIRSFQDQANKYDYNLMGLFGVALNRPLERKNSYFCSQFVSHVLQQGGINLFDKQSGLVKPTDFVGLDDMDIIYEGRLYDYPPIKDRIERGPIKYHSFPFRKYCYQRLNQQILKDISNDKKLSFRNDFLRHKKLYIYEKLKRGNLQSKEGL